MKFYIGQKVRIRKSGAHQHTLDYVYKIIKQSPKRGDITIARISGTTGDFVEWSRKFDSTGREKGRDDMYRACQLHDANEPIKV